MNRSWILNRIGVLLSLVLLLAVAAACSSGDDNGSAGAPPTAEPALGPLPTERLLVGIVAFSQEANVRRIVGQIAGVQFDPIDESLIGMDPATGLKVPELATEWSLENGNAWRFKLREGVQFHKGWGEVTAEDVKFAYEEYIKEDAVGGVRAPLVRGIDNVEVVNDHEIVFHLKLFDADLTNLWSRAQPAVAIVSKKHFDSLGGDPDFSDEPLVGSGPYQFLAREQNAWIRYERFDGHRSLTPDFPEFEFRYMNESSTRLAALLTGEIHITNLPDDLMPQATNGGMNVVAGTSPLRRAWMTFLCCYVDPETKAYPGHPDSPLQDIRVRQALNKAVNRDELNATLFAGKGDPMYVHSFASSLAGWNEDWVRNFPTAYGYDPAAAKSLLSAAGYNDQNPLETNVHVFNITQLPGAADIAEAISAYFMDIGVKVDLVSEDSATRRAKGRSLGYSNHMWLGTTSAGQIVGSSVYTSNTSFSRSATTPDVDAKFLQIRAETDDGRRAQLWTEYGNLIYDSYINIPLFRLPAEVLVNPEIVASWEWPGALSGFWSHLWNVKANR